MWRSFREVANWSVLPRPHSPGEELVFSLLAWGHPPFFPTSLRCAHNHISLCCLAILQSSSGKLATLLSKGTIACFVLCPLTPSLPPDDLVSSFFNRNHQRETPSCLPRLLPSKERATPACAPASSLHFGRWGTPPPAQGPPRSGPLLLQHLAVCLGIPTNRRPSVFRHHLLSYHPSPAVCPGF